MHWTKSFVPKARGPSRSASWSVFGIGQSITVSQSGMIPNADLLRKWSDKMPFLKSAKDLRRYQAISADWDVLPIDPRSTDYSQNKRKQIKKLLETPNIKGRSGSFSDLLGPVMDDMLTVANGVIVPEFNNNDQIGALNYEDGALLRHRMGWKSEADGFRYALLTQPGATTAELYDNNELIVMTLNETTWNPYGTSPVQVVFQALAAWEDTFNSVYASQKNRTPAGILNLGGMPEEELRKLKALYDEVEGQSTIAFLNHPLDQFKFQDIGSLDFEKMGTWKWIDLLIRCICTVFQCSPVSLQWTQDINRATAKEQLRITNDQGIEPLMRMIASVINTEIIPTFGTTGLHFVWNDILVKNQTEAAQTLKDISGDRVIPFSVNEQRKIAGLAPYTLRDFDGDVKAFAYVDQPLIWTKEAMQPPSVLAPAPVSQSFDIQHQAQLENAQAAAPKLLPQNNDTQNNDPSDDEEGSDS